MGRILYPILCLAAVDGLLFLAARRAAWRKAALGALLVVTSAFFCLAVLEVGISFLSQSDGFNITMSSRNWFARYWKPVNSLGLRDVEPTPPAAGQKAVMVLGDSFASGHGINDVTNRFAEKLGQTLDGKARIYVAANIGWDSEDELAALRSYPVKPDVAILAYYVNDIFGAAKKTGFEMPFGVKFPQNPVVKYLTENYALANFVYWRLARMGGVEDAEASFWGRLKQAYADPATFAEHERELEALVEYCRERNIRLIVVTFPNLVDVPGSAPLTAKVSAFFQKDGVLALDLSPMLDGRPAKELVVNGVDAHPNEALHAEVAGMLAKVLAP